jgi:hypothetical protein
VLPCADDVRFAGLKIAITLRGLVLALRQSGKTYPPYHLGVPFMTQTTDFSISWFVKQMLMNVHGPQHPAAVARLEPLVTAETAAQHASAGQFRGVWEALVAVHAARDTGGSVLPPGPDDGRHLEAWLSAAHAAADALLVAMWFSTWAKVDASWTSLHPESSKYKPRHHLGSADAT